MSGDCEQNVARLAQLKQLFLRLGAEGDQQAETMARQLLKRARQISTKHNISEAAAAEDLLRKVIEARQGGSSC